MECLLFAGVYLGPHRICMPTHEWSLGESEWQMENHPFGEAGCGDWGFIVYVGAFSLILPCGAMLCGGTVLGISHVLLAVQTRTELIWR